MGDRDFKRPWISEWQREVPVGGYQPWPDFPLFIGPKHQTWSVASTTGSDVDQIEDLNDDLSDGESSDDEPPYVYVRPPRFRLLSPDDAF